MPKSSKDYPRRGEIYIANLDPGFGREIRKRRPVLIISSNSINQNTHHVIIIPLSSIVPKIISPDMVHLGKIKGLQEDSVFLPVYIRSIDQDRLIKKIGVISDDKLLEVEESLKLVLGILSFDNTP